MTDEIKTEEIQIPEPILEMQRRVNDPDEVPDGSFHDIRCINGERVFYLPANRAGVEGHIYSKSGMDEFRISGSCEFHFDRMFAEPDDPCLNGPITVYV